ncbi:MFS transporter [Cupriavidus necator]|uniref:MFS transporter n=1 Tax=Cupriavidus necator TaxID=106590 RepID=UPI0039C12675
MSTTATSQPQPIAEDHHSLSAREERQVVLASTLGTLFEWYDFYIYGSLAVFMSSVLFPPNNPTAALLASLGALAAGFVIRPLGAIFFGYLGDLLGRKVTFLMTVVMMGGGTVLMGCIPSYESIGHLSWILLILLRLVQGLAVGGEYGGAVIYVSEHCVPKRRGLLTSWIQTTGSAGLMLCLFVILATQASMSAEAFRSWGWRVPFILSLVLLVISIYIRSKLHESPVFTRMKADRRLSKNPIRDTFLDWGSVRTMLIALFGVTAGMGATYFTGQFYVMIFLQQVVQIEQTLVYKMVIAGFLIGAPAYVFFGWISDRIGRKWVMIAGLLLAALCYRFLFGALLEAGNPGLVAAMKHSPVTIHASVDGDVCNARMSAALVGSHPDNKKACVLARKLLVSRGISFSYAAPVQGTDVAMTVGGTTIRGFDAAAYDSALTQAGYPSKADPMQVDVTRIVLILIFMTAMVAMVYGPVASYLVELFPPHIRYTSLSFPYHIGAGVVGGSLPFLATFLSISGGNVLTGLWYPVVVTSVTAVIGAQLLPNINKARDNKAS